MLLHRKLLESACWKGTTTQDKILLITCLLMANYQDNKWFNGQKETTISRGTFITSLKGLAQKSKLSFQSIRTSLSHLEKVGFLTSTSTNKYRYITIMNYNSYQNKDAFNNKQSNKQLTSSQQAPNKHLTTTNKRQQRNKRKNIKYIYTVFERWNSKKIIIHKDIEKLKLTISKYLNTYCEKEIIEAIDNYKDVLDDPNCWFTHTWTLGEFLTRGLEKFLTINKPLERYKKRFFNKSSKLKGDELFQRNLEISNEILKEGESK